MAVIHLNYGDIMWTSGTTSGGSPDTGLGGTPAQVGFNAGDAHNLYSLPGSRNASIVDIVRTTNIGVIGHWVFRTDEEVVEDVCKMEVTTGTVRVFPSSGSMLGGDIFYVQGPCFDLQHNISCNFFYPSGIETQGVVLNPLKAACMTPIFFQTGLIRFYVSYGYGSKLRFEGVLNILNLEDVVAPVTVDYELSSTLVTVSWDPSLTPYQFVNIELFIYSEDFVNKFASLMRNMIKENVDGASGVVVFKAVDVTLRDINDHIGIVRVSKWNGKTDWN